MYSEMYLIRIQNGLSLTGCSALPLTLQLKMYLSKFLYVFVLILKCIWLEFKMVWVWQRLLGSASDTSIEIFRFLVVLSCSSFSPCNISISITCYIGILLFSYRICRALWACFTPTLTHTIQHYTYHYNDKILSWTSICFQKLVCMDVKRSPAKFF